MFIAEGESVRLRGGMMQWSSRVPTCTSLVIIFFSSMIAFFFLLLPITQSKFWLMTNRKELHRNGSDNETR